MDTFVILQYLVFRETERQRDCSLVFIAETEMPAYMRLDTTIENLEGYIESTL